MTYTLLDGYTASAHQAAIFDAIADPHSGSKIVKSVAGSGKTTVIKNALRYMPAGASVQGFAFNTAAARNLQAALAEVVAMDGPARYTGVRMGTFHSAGFGAICKFLGKAPRTVSTDGGKCRRLLAAHLGDDEFELYSSFVCKLVGLAKGEGIGALCPDTAEQWWKLVDHHGLYLDTEEGDTTRAVEIARKLLAYSNVCAKEADIDFDDQLYLVVLWKLRLWQNDIVFVDEAQDTNPVRRAIARLALRPRGRLVAVGDPRQSIYGFTGASTDAMDIIAREFRTSELPLTVSYRCAQAVVKQAQTWVDYIEPSDFAPVGRVAYDVSLDEALAALQQTDAVLCRQTAPLVTLAYKLIAKGRAARVAGKEIGEGLVNLVRSQRAKGIDALIVKLTTWCEREVNRFLAKGDETRAEGIKDRFDCVMVIIDNLPESGRTIPQLINRIVGLFEDKSNGGAVLTLSTVHKAKGQEWDTVVILRPDLMPSRAARQQWQVDQEENLMYVAATRAKSTLLYLHPEAA